MERPRWSLKVILLNNGLKYPTLLLGGYILWENSLPFFLVYLLIWIGLQTVGRYFVCRACPYFGQVCPDFGFGYMARVIFSKDDTRGFNALACMVDFVFVVILFLLPVVVWLLSLVGGFVEPFNANDHTLAVTYLVFSSTVGVAHFLTACGTCEVSGCPLSKAAKDRR